MNKSKIELIENLKKELLNYKERELRLGVRMNKNISENTFSGFLYEGAIINVEDLENELHITIQDKTNSKENEIKVRLLAYEKPTYDYNDEYELQDIEYYEVNPHNFDIVEIKCGQNCKIAQHLVLRGY